MNIDKRFADACRELECNRLDDAQKSLVDILSESPDYFPAINKLGVVCTRKKQFDNAKTYFSKVLEINPDYAPSIMNMGNLSLETGNDEEAMEYYKRAIRKDSAYHMAYYNLAVLYKGKGQYDEYMKYLKEYKKYYRQYINNKQQHPIIRDKEGNSFPTKMILIFTVGICIIVVLMIWL